MGRFPLIKRCPFTLCQTVAGAVFACLALAFCGKIGLCPLSMYVEIRRLFVWAAHAKTCQRREHETAFPRTLPVCCRDIGDYGLGQKAGKIRLSASTNSCRSVS